jgi:hypothetical protein
MGLGGTRFARPRCVSIRPFIAGLACCLLSATLTAQAPARPLRFTVVASPGVGSVGPSLFGAVSVNHAYGDLVLRGVGMNEWASDGIGTEKWRDVALLYGYRDDQGTGWLSLAAGPAMVFGVRQGTVPLCNESFTFCGYDDVSFKELALAVQADLVWIATHYLGLGVNLFGNVNGYAPFGGGGVSVHVGRLR